MKRELLRLIRNRFDLFKIPPPNGRKRHPQNAFRFGVTDSLATPNTIAKFRSELSAREYIEFLRDRAVREASE